MKRKTFKFQLPQHMYEEFYRLFPSHGERSRFLRKVISLAIQKGKEKDSFEVALLDRLKSIRKGRTDE